MFTTVVKGFAVTVIFVAVDDSGGSADGDGVPWTGKTNPK